MKKIIGGKIYDTDTATRIDVMSNNRSYSDFSYFSETLYRKRTGEYFLYGEGGPMSKYAVSRGDNSWSGGSAIIPLSYDKAKEWAEENMDADDYQKEFGEVSEEDDDVRTSFQLPADVAAKLERMAAKAGTSKSAIICTLIREKE